MKRDIHKLAAWLEQQAQAGVAIEQKILEWKKAEKQEPSKKQAKAS
jgi:hypothetical protein